MRYTLDLAGFKLGVVLQQTIMKALRGAIKEMVPKEDNPKVIADKSALYVIEFDGDPKHVQGYKSSLWGIRKAYKLAGIKFSFEVVKKK